MKTKKLFSVISILLVAVFALGIGVAQAGTLNPSFTDFGEAGFVTGASVNDLAPDGTFVNISNINNCVQAWRVGNSSPTTEDEEVVDLSPDPHGKVWRLSQGGAMGNLGAAPHSPNNGTVTPLTAGELNPAGGHLVYNDAGCGQPTTNNFYGEMEFKSVTENPVEMSLSVVASSHDQRHGYVRFLDDGMGSGLDLQFVDTVGTAFNYSILDLDISYNEWHTLGIGIEFVDDLETGVLGDADAIGNDIVKVFLDGEIVHCGTSWESYYASDSNDDRRIQSVDRLMFSGGLVEEQLGGGMYFDNVLITDDIPSGSCPGDNLPPIADADGPYLVAVEQSVALDGSGSSDPDGDTLTEAWTETGAPSLGTISGSNFTAGTEAGITEVTLTVDDGRGGTDTDTAMVVVYDPDGGFVTGGGWIDSPEGAYHPDEYPTGENFFLDTFDTDPTLSSTNVDGAWYPDRYQPAAFESVVFDGDNRLHVAISADDYLPHGSTFYNYQGRKYNLWNDVNTYITADLYVGTDWEGNQRHASLWATTYDADGYISGYPIAGFTEGTGFRIYTQDTDENTGNGYQPGWYDIGYPADFEYGNWYTIRAELTETAYRYYINGELVWSDSATFESVVWANMMLQAYNFGEDYDVYWDNVGAGPVLPVGRATFGFVSKYKKGASVPTGNTEFQFKAGDLNFQSSSYEWLVINQGGTNAQFKGYGTINGAGNYGFMLWATDDSPDTFRIKIWDAATEDVVYDNGTDQAIGGGSIVVHKK